MCQTYRKHNPELFTDKLGQKPQKAKKAPPKKK